LYIAPSLTKEGRRAYKGKAKERRNKLKTKTGLELEGEEPQAELICLEEGGEVIMDEMSPESILPDNVLQDSSSDEKNTETSFSKVTFCSQSGTNNLITINPSDLSMDTTGS
jgi:hypothetical protein